MSEKTKARVRQAAAALGYAPNAIGRALALGHSTRIGLVVTDLHNHFYGHVIPHLHSELSRQGYELVLVTEASEAAPIAEQIVANGLSVAHTLRNMSSATRATPRQPSCGACRQSLDCKMIHCTGEIEGAIAGHTIVVRANGGTLRFTMAVQLFAVLIALGAVVATAAALTQIVASAINIFFAKVIEVQEPWFTLLYRGEKTIEGKKANERWCNAAAIGWVKFVGPGGRRFWARGVHDGP